MKWIIRDPVLWLLLMVALLVCAAHVANPSQAWQLAAISRAEGIHYDLDCIVPQCCYLHR
jgi:hypothetical protein